VSGRNAVEHGAWDCAWTRATVGRQPTAPGERGHVWVCVRDPRGGRLVTDDTCRDCPRWQPRDESEGQVD
jgi:hypothetical protein